MTNSISPGKQVTLHFTLRLSDDDIIDSTLNKKPATCVMGDGNFLPGFEAVLMGLTSGAKQTFVIKPEQGFGLHRAENIHNVPRAQFDPRVELSKGLMMDFADGKATLPGVIADIFDEYVIVDFNHPLAGRDVIFEVEIIDVQIPQTQSTAISVVQL